MSDNLGSLVISLSATVDKFAADMAKAASVAERQSKAMEVSIMGVKGAITGVATGAVAMYVKSLVDAAEATGKFASRSGHSIGFVSELGFAMKQGNVETSAWQGSLGKFNQSLVEANDKGSKSGQVFRLLGVDITKGPTEAFRQFAEKASAIDDAAVKTAVFREILGKTGDQLIPVAANLGETMQEARDLGITMSEETAVNAEKLNDSVGRLTQKLEAMVLNGITPAISGLAEIADNFDKGARKGDLFTTSMRELGKIGGATLGGLGGVLESAPDMFGVQRWIGRQMKSGGESMFNAFTQQDSLLDQILKRTQPKSATATPNSKGLKGVLSGDATKAAGELKQYESALQSLEQELGKLNDQTRNEQVLYQVTRGSLKGLTEDHKVELLVIADEIDKRNQLIRQIDLQVRAVEQLIAVAERNADVVADFHSANKAEIDQMAFETALIGKKASEQEKLNRLRMVDLRLQQALATAARNDPDGTSYGATAEALYAQADRQREAINKSVDERLEAERRWGTGAKRAMDEYVDHATNAAEQASTLFTNAFRSMEDALVDFVKTGKLDFRSLADSIISDLIRIQIRQSMAQAIGSSGGGIFGAISGALGGLFGGGSSSGGLINGNASLANGYGGSGLGLKLPSLDVGTDYVPHDMVAMIHKGERIIPASENVGGGASMNFYNTYNLGSNVSRAEVQQQVEQGNARLRADIAKDLRTNGALAQQVRSV